MQSTKHRYEFRECKCLPPSTKENKISFEQSANRTAKQKGRLERNNLSFDQVSFMGELKNLTAAKHFFHSTEKNGMTNDKNYVYTASS